MTFISDQTFCGTSLGYNNNYGSHATFYKNAHVHKIIAKRNKQKRIKGNKNKSNNLAKPPPHWTA